MDKHMTDIVSYLSWPGLLVAFLIGDRNRSRFHLNQALVIWLAMTLVGLVWKLVRTIARIPILGWSVGLTGGLVCAAGGLFCLLCLFIGIVNAFQDVEKEVPLLGRIHLL